MPTPRPLSAKKLRWSCPLNRLDFESTARLQPLRKIIGQGDALDALQFGLSSKIKEHHVFVRGLSGTGRSTLVKRLLEELRVESPPLRDRCYLHNFAQPDQPRLLTLAAGQGAIFRRHMRHLAAFVQTGLREILSSDTVSARRQALERAAEQTLQSVIQPFEKSLTAAGLGLVTVQTQAMSEKAIFPLVKGEAVVPEEYDRLHAEGTIDDAAYQRVSESRRHYEKELEEIHEKAGEIRESYSEQVEKLFRTTVERALHRRLHLVRRAFPELAVQKWLDELLNDLMEQRLPQLGKDTSFTSLYRVNVVVDRSGQTSCPVVVEGTPTLSNLVGTINLEYTPDQEPRASHMGICAGSLLAADGGYLILEARDLLSDPETWKYLVRTLRTGKLEVQPPEAMGPWPGPGLKPESIDIKVKVVLLGDTQIFYLLDELDSNFRDLFKVLADFEVTIPNDRAGARDYARWVARFVREESLPHFSRKGVAALIEHGVRVAADGGRITARFGRMADLVRESAWLASRENTSLVKDTHVKEAIHRRKSRADHPSRRFRRQIAEGTIRVSTSGSQVGQVNGLAVISAGNMTYGFPARITATIGPGTAGVINIERESALSGAIHTKGFYILGGLLRHLLRTEHPLAFDASVAFEQSYGGIDGDSASGAETCCLLSALTDIPLRQDIAMTGAIDQMGNIMAIGAVNEKIEGFFDTCADQGLSGSQGVIIPRANANDLQLREDVVKACAAGRFAVWAVGTVHEALHIFTGMPAGKRNAKGRYPKGSVLHEAMQKALEFWERAVSTPPAPEPKAVKGRG
jgi:ATP-dependent Lon protease